MSVRPATSKLVLARLDDDDDGDSPSEIPAPAIAPPMPDPATAAKLAAAAPEPPIPGPPMPAPPAPRPCSLVATSTALSVTQPTSTVTSGSFSSSRSSDETGNDRTTVTVTAMQQTGGVTLVTSIIAEASSATPHLNPGSSTQNYTSAGSASTGGSSGVAEDFLIAAGALAGTTVAIIAIFFFLRRRSKAHKKRRARNINEYESKTKSMRKHESNNPPIQRSDEMVEPRAPPTALMSPQSSIRNQSVFIIERTDSGWFRRLRRGRPESDPPSGNQKDDDEFVRLFQSAAMVGSEHLSVASSNAHHQEMKLEGDKESDSWPVSRREMI